MTKQEKLTFRILASLYPDRRPSEIRKIIDDVLAKDERPDDIELWAILTKEKSEVIDTKKEPEVKEKIIEKHYYHNHWYEPYTITTSGFSGINIATEPSEITVCGTINNALDGSTSCASCASAASDSAFVTLTSNADYLV